MKDKYLRFITSVSKQEAISRPYLVATAIRKLRKILTRFEIEAGKSTSTYLVVTKIRYSLSEWLSHLQVFIAMADLDPCTITWQQLNDRGHLQLYKLHESMHLIDEVSIKSCLAEDSHETNHNPNVAKLYRQRRFLIEAVNAL